MVTFSLSYLGDLRCRNIHDPSGAVVVTDAPVDNHGLGQAHSPTDLVASGLGVCMLTVIGIIGRRDGIDLTGMTARVEKHMSTDQPRRIVRIVVQITVPGAVPADRRAVLERAAATCPVASSLHPAIAQELSFSWG
ncbi:redox protein [Planctomycetota bacterium]|nr:redox protein [Planctomycetota bacterium]